MLAFVAVGRWGGGWAGPDDTTAAAAIRGGGGGDPTAAAAVFPSEKPVPPLEATTTPILCFLSSGWA